MAGQPAASASKAKVHAKGGSLELRIVVPKHRRIRAGAPRYLSPSTQYLTVTIYNSSNVKVANVGQGLTAGSPGCTPATSAPVSCTIQIALDAGSYSANLTTYDAQGGNVLSQAVGYPFKIARGRANSIPIVLDGVPASVQVVPEADSIYLGGNQTSGFQLAGVVPQTIDVFGVDAGGNVILGAGAPTVSLASGSSPIVITPGGKTHPNRFVVSRTSFSSSPVTLTATATIAAGSTAATASPTLQCVPLLYLYQSSTMYQRGGVGQYVPWSNASIGTLVTGLSGNASLNTSVQQNQLLALDASGNLYVLDAPNNQIVVYAPGASEPSRSITSGVSMPNAIALDSLGNLYVANAGLEDVAVYPPGSSAPTRTITNGIAVPQALAFDSSRDLFVENNYTVTEYDSSGASQRTISSGIVIPYGIGVDGSNRLYVGSMELAGGSNYVYEYAPGSTSIANSLLVGPSTLGTSAFVGGIAVDSSGDVCAADILEVQCGAIGGFFALFQDFSASSAGFSPSMAFDSGENLYMLARQPNAQFARAYAPLSDASSLYPTPTNVYSGTISAFSLVVQR